MPETARTAGLSGRMTIEEWVEFARRDDCLDRMVPSDLRQLVGDLHRAIASPAALPWIRIKTMEDLPKKPGLADYEQIVCLIIYDGNMMVRLWNCEHQVWDREDGDDYFCDPLEPTHYMVVETPGAE